MSENSLEQLTYIGRTTFRNQRRLFGIRRRDWRHHAYVIGQTGTGKSTLLATLMRQDLVDGRGFALIDPHGDLADQLLTRLPDHRRPDVQYLNLPDPTCAIGFNPLTCPIAHTRPVAAAALLDVFKKLWDESWGPRLEHLLRYALLALVEVKGATLGDILRIMEDEHFRKTIVPKVSNSQVRRFWLDEFEQMSPGRRAEAIAPVQNKIGAFLAHASLQRVLSGTDPIDLRSLMDRGGILVVNLSKGRIGEDASALCGALLLSTLARLGLERADQDEEQRSDFSIYLDEFQTFTTLTVAGMLAELRKYRVSLVLAHQYLAQLEPEVREAIFGNVGTLVAFRLGATDGKVLAPVFGGEIEPAEFTRLPNHHVYARLFADGAPVSAFSAEALKL